MSNKDQSTIIIKVTPEKIDVKYSDWLKLNPAKLSRVFQAMSKAWRMERAKVIHADRVSKAKAAKEAEEAATESVDE